MGIRQSVCWLAALTACGGPPLTDAAVKAEATTQLAAANPAGRTGLQVEGKGVWFAGPMIDPECVLSKQIAFHDDEKSRPAMAKKISRITPTYASQRWFTASTDRGYCIYVGDDPFGTVGEVRWIEDHWEVDIELGLGKKMPYGECFATHHLNRTITVHPADEGPPRIEGDLAMVGPACPHPLPSGEERGGSDKRPEARPARAPKRAEVQAALEALDNALWDGDFLAAVEATSCFNLWEEKKVGSCSVGELIGVGPVKRGELRAQDGTSWLGATADSIDAFRSITADRSDRTMYQVHYRDARSKKDRTVTVQWVDDTWKVVGVVEIKGEGLTSARFVTDLHDVKRRKIFERRMKGEEIDYRGELLKPWEEEEPKK
jgi:hypothetical protein